MAVLELWRPVDTFFSFLQPVWGNDWRDLSHEMDRHRANSIKVTVYSLPRHD